MEEEKKGDGKFKMGCSILMFIFTAAGIPAALQGEGPIGSMVVIIFGLFVAGALAKWVYDL